MSSGKQDVPSNPLGIARLSNKLTLWPSLLRMFNAYLGPDLSISQSTSPTMAETVCMKGFRFLLHTDTKLRRPCSQHISSPSLFYLRMCLVYVLRSTTIPIVVATMCAEIS
jgi:hypothetical protein